MFFLLSSTLTVRSSSQHDPRSTIIRKLADEVFAVTGPEPLLDIALKLQEVALADDYFIKRHLNPNVGEFAPRPALIESDTFKERR